MMKKFIFVVLIFCNISLVQAMTLPKENNEQLMLVLEVKEEAGSPKAFRTSSMLADVLWNKEKEVSLTGLKDLRASGSGEFSEEEFVNLTKIVGGPLYVLDLRKEPHAFLNGRAITWTAKRNWVNTTMDYEEAIGDEAEKINNLKQNTVVDLLTSSAYKKGISEKKVFTIDKVESEENMVKRYGANYLRVTVIDHLRPSDAEVDRFIDYIRNLPQGAWLHVHCRAGHGRTTTFLIMYDLLRNAKNISLNDAVLRQGAMPPYFKALEVDITSSEYIFQHERVEFLKRFYRFAQDYNNGYKGNWSEWSKNHAVYF